MVKEVELEQIESFAAQLVSLFSHKIIVLKGDLGAGKTTLVKAVLAVLGAADDVSSPTFGIANEVKLPTETAYHLDLYRITHADELAQFGVEEYIYSGGYCFIEWPEIAMDYIPKTHHSIGIENLNATTRKITFV